MRRLEGASEPEQREGLLRRFYVWTRDRSAVDAFEEALRVLEGWPTGSRPLDVAPVGFMCPPGLTSEYPQDWWAERLDRPVRCGSKSLNDPLTWRFGGNLSFACAGRLLGLGSRRPIGMDTQGGTMNSGFRIASVASAAALVFALAPATATAAAAACASRSEVRTQVTDLVHSLRDDVQSRPARSATAHALVEAIRTFRGVDADTAAERQGLGTEISALARQLKDAASLVERKALVAEIKALREQRERGAFTAEERAELRAAVAALKGALVDSTDRRAEARAVSAAVRDLQAQFSCKG